MATASEKEKNRGILITVGQVTATAVLHKTPTADAIWSALPIEARANTWGDEIYFSIPVNASLEQDAREVVQLGDLGYWPPGTAFCIFFGPTPASHGDEIRPASAVNVVGRVEGDPKVFKKVADGAKVVIRRG
ncbi:MAG: cyclophilin-like fold protein [Candidatus Methylomirabilis sp.]